jgi:2-oxoglutarate ferredoxin oxidoreductase subunit delta
MKGKRKVKGHLFEHDWCKGCGICAAFCKKNVLELDQKDKVYAARPEDCIGCRLCEFRCPDLVIEVISEEEQ